MSLRLATKGRLGRRTPLSMSVSGLLETSQQSFANGVGMVCALVTKGRLARRTPQSAAVAGFEDPYRNWSTQPTESFTMSEKVRSEKTENGPDTTDLFGVRQSSRIKGSLED